VVEIKFRKINIFIICVHCFINLKFLSMRKFTIFLILLMILLISSSVTFAQVKGNKVKPVKNTESLEKLLSEIQTWPGVNGTKTTYVLSTIKETTAINI